MGFKDKLKSLAAVKALFKKKSKNDASTIVDQIPAKPRISVDELNNKLDILEKKRTLVDDDDDDAKKLDSEIRDIKKALIEIEEQRHKEQFDPSFKGKLKRFFSKSGEGVPDTPGGLFKAGAFAIGKILMYLLAPVAFVFAIIKGIIPFTPLQAVGFAALVIIFLFAMAKGHSGTAGASFIAMTLMIVLLTNVNALASTGPVSGAFDLLGVEKPELEKPNVAGMISTGWKDAKCAYYDAVDPDNPREECVEPLIDDDSNIQVSKKDIEIASFTVEPRTAIVNQAILMTLNIENAGVDTQHVESIFLARVGDVQAPVELKPESFCQTGSSEKKRFEYGDRYDFDIDYCTIDVTGGGTQTVSAIYNITDKPEHGTIKFETGIIYDFNVVSTLLLKASDTLSTSRTQVQSETTTGSANLILSSQNQPLYKGDNFQFSFTIKNNDKENGEIFDPNATILLPADIVTIRDSSLGQNRMSECVNVNGHAVEVFAPTHDRCSSVLNNMGLTNHYCLLVDGIASVKDTERFQCVLQARGDIQKDVTSTALGVLDYTYLKTDTATVVVADSPV